MSKKRRHWTPEMFALYLMNKDITYVLPTISAEKIVKELPEIHIGKKAVDRLRNDPAFEETVKREFIDRIKNKKILQQMFFTYLQKIIEKNLDLPQPSTKVLEVLGVLSGEYNPKAQKKTAPPLTAAQKIRLIHAKEQAEAARRARMQEEGKDGSAV